ncbi:undecaprenyl/decaprenyl-phosphate alpha-N-acetylglucosaminyl 1-phosphate transferase [Planosporangium flavigriseum]|uniref:UDP-GlcNAc:undecaprenyl-phosphate GlcNAc-1-phosphate transferase n=1 Tax=Planosporangium flavigriseum TaxID=373681 RepID=A0A8J3PPZ5_9ACTN|nr:MraY family glycosyltransferase [Planosporangium flavigriseum]NJC67514.1 undecaprenyl/decaprenyl-phosphate alpha-N-acetylglucosaminyl 1-phosphate transferase [Planosporangium flavigriseum]GIG75536.1 hypothetical protein Pfl04_39400 [Planosporangium flavigriseum]
MIWPILVAGPAAMGLAGGLTEPLRRLALRLNLTDRPAAHKAHARPTPYLGGAAVAAGTLVPALFFAPTWALRPMVLLLGGLAVAVIGLLDDARSLRPGPRLAAEMTVAAALVGCGIRIPVSGNPWVDAVLTAVWVVVLTNSFNLLDNMDGAAASIAVATAGMLAALALSTGQPGVAILLICLAAAAAGFLCHNWPPARIFMGDTGSLFIGFLISGSAAAAIGAGGGAEGHPLRALTALVLVTFIATVDTSLVLISRRRAGRSWLAGGTDHVTHRLRLLGLTRSQVPWMLMAMATLTGALGVLVAGGVLLAPAVLAGVVAVGVTAVWLLLRVPVYPATVTEKPADSPGVRVDETIGSVFTQAMPLVGGQLVIDRAASERSAAL